MLIFLKLPKFTIQIQPFLNQKYLSLKSFQLERKSKQKSNLVDLIQKEYLSNAEVFHLYTLGILSVDLTLGSL